MCGAEGEQYGAPAAVRAVPARAAPAKTLAPTEANATTVRKPPRPPRIIVDNGVPSAGDYNRSAAASRSATRSVPGVGRPIGHVSFLDPQVRLLTAKTGNPSGTLTVSVQYTDASGSHNVTLATFGGSSRVQPSPALVFNPWQLKGNVQVTLSASPGSNWVISGVYVDPS